MVPGGRSPITSPNIPDPTPTNPETAVQAIDELLWALIGVLVENGAVSSARLADKMEELLAGGIRKSGFLSSQEEEDRFRLSLILGRVRDLMPKQ
jgi:hypothetical protein